MYIDNFRDEYARYKAIGEKAMAQVPDESLNRIVAPEGNSIAMIVRHIGGNFVSRFTNFLTEDGEKPWRDRDDEFAEGDYARAHIDEAWRTGWAVVESALGSLGDDDLTRTVKIRGQELSVHEALCRSVAHVAMHVGQIILLARMLAADDWRWISIPKGQSKAYNLNPTREKHPAR